MSLSRFIVPVLTSFNRVKEHLQRVSCPHPRACGYLNLAPLCLLQEGPLSPCVFKSLLSFKPPSHHALFLSLATVSRSLISCPLPHSLLGLFCLPCLPCPNCPSPPHFPSLPSLPSALALTPCPLYPPCRVIWPSLLALLAPFVPQAKMQQYQAYHGNYLKVCAQVGQQANPDFTPQVTHLKLQMGIATSQAPLDMHLICFIMFILPPM